MVHYFTYGYVIDEDLSDDDIVCNGLTSDPEPDQHIDKSQITRETVVRQDTTESEDGMKKVGFHS